MSDSPQKKRIIFVHYEQNDENLDEHYTVAVECPGTKAELSKFTIRDVVFSFFLKSPLTSLPYAVFTKMSQKFDIENSVDLQDEKGREVSHDVTCSQFKGDDIILKLKGDKYHKTKKEIANMTKANIEKPIPVVKPKSEKKETEINLVATQLGETALAAFKKGDYVSAQASALKAIEKYPKIWQPYSILAGIEEACLRFEKAASYWKQVVNLKAEDLDAIISYGTNLFEAKKYEEAGQVFQTGISIARSQGNIAKMDEITGYLGLVLMKTDKQEAAHALVSQVLSRDQSNSYCLVVYAQSLQYMAEKKKTEKSDQFMTEALQVRLNNITKNPTHATLKKELAASIHYPGGLKRLVKLLQCENIPYIMPGDSLAKQYSDYSNGKIIPQSNPSLTQAFSLLSTITKEEGAIVESAHLQRCAYTFDLRSSAEALALIHAYETCNEYANALIAARMYFSYNHISVKSVSNEAVDRELALVKPQEWPQQKLFPGEVLEKYLPNLTEDTAYELIDEESKEMPTYSDTELYTIAIYCTMVKICYSVGLFTIAREIAQYVYPLTKSHGSLHHTFIRNENAYFTYVSMLLKEVKMENVIHLTPSSKVIYAVGDSHCLSCAWKPITYKDTQYTLVPCPATGIKIWHTRKGCEFYPRKTLELVLNAIPKESKVILLLGEIDCREGFEKAVKKTKFPSISAVSQSTVDIYAELIKKTRADKKFELFIHPVNPVLDVTRFLVLPFNAQLKSAVTKIAKSDPHVHYLDIVDKLIEPSPSQTSSSSPYSSDYILRPRYELDGTHLSPKYVDEVLAPTFASL